VTTFNRCKDHRTNTCRYLFKVQRLEDRDYNFVPPPQGGIPSEVFATDRSLKLHGSSLHLKHHAPAHIDIRRGGIVRVGDVLKRNLSFIDYSTGGSIDGMIGASDANLARPRIKQSLCLVTGSPPAIGTKRKEFRDKLVVVRDKVAKLKKQGRSRDELSQRSRPRPSMQSSATSLSMRITSPG
jgi:hypothetical protein